MRTGGTERKKKPRIERVEYENIEMIKEDEDWIGEEKIYINGTQK